MGYVKLLKIFFVLLVPVLLLACFVVLATGAAPYKVYVIHTGSMSPTIPSGSAVLVHEGHYRVGQVITFSEDGLTVTHRLVSISSSGLTTTKGDANLTADPWHVPTSQIVGGVVFAPRYVGYVIIYLRSPLGLASVLIAALILWQIWSLTGDAAVANDPKKPASGESLGESESGPVRPRVDEAATAPSMGCAWP
jgi:signal peptidase I